LSQLARGICLGLRKIRQNNNEHSQQQAHHYILDHTQSHFHRALLADHHTWRPGTRSLSRPNVVPPTTSPCGHIEHSLELDVGHPACLDKYNPHVSKPNHLDQTHKHTKIYFPAVSNPNKASHSNLPRSHSHNGPTNPRKKSQTNPKRKHNSRSKGLRNLQGLKRTIRSSQADSL
jgi:hypothetical protein